MTVKQPPTSVQIPLFEILPDKKLSTNGEARTRYGRIVEEIVISSLGLTDIPNSGSHDVVYDAWGHGTFCEIKSVRAGAKIPIYEWRRTKDREAGVPLVYVIAIHRTKSCPDMTTAWEQMMQTLNRVLVVPAWAVDLMARKEPLRMITEQGPPGERMGYRRKGYCEGYRNLNLSALEKLAFHPDVHRRSVLMGLPNSAMVRFHSSLTPWF